MKLVLTPQEAGKFLILGLQTAGYKAEPAAEVDWLGTDEDGEQTSADLNQVEVEVTP